ncbi:TlpA family protein disulfide reductase [Streptomyces sp. NPDC058401]|uniref:TlpA family protein disulfide reductase n=1 Tax=Streptomyces sp. NPDC058401 TaxID=3346480 RepID=UPI003669BFC5
MVKRLREHSEIIAAGGGAGGEPPLIEVGEPIGDFSALTLEGRPLGQDALSDETVVAFFSTTCGPCKAKLPSFVEFAEAVSLTGRRPVAVVVDDVNEPEAFVEALGPVADVVVERSDGALCTAFRTESYPTILRVAADATGALVVTANKVALDLPAAVSA